MDDRLKRFREYIRRLDPAGNPQQALRDQLYVDPPGRSLAVQLEIALQLAPASSHLVVGSVGGGKSTQLLLTADRLQRTTDTSVAYLDVSRQHDLSKSLRGVLLTLAGLALAKAVEKVGESSVRSARVRVHNLAYGYQEEISSEFDDYPYDPDEGGPYRFQPGKLSPIQRRLDYEMLEWGKILGVLKSALPASRPHYVVLFDSLDRLADMDKFREGVVDDLRVLRSAGIGVVVVGPPRSIYGAHRGVVELFDRLHTQSALDVEYDEDSRAFLSQVLTRRADDAGLPASGRDALVRWSGGILRDLISIARGAVEEAFLRGAAQVEDVDIGASADRFGRSLMIGLRPHELEVLQRLREHHVFVPTTDDELALIESRRVLEYQGMTVRHQVHPTIEPLLQALGEAVSP